MKIVQGACEGGGGCEKLRQEEKLLVLNSENVRESPDVRKKEGD